jgi:hypothetical protein
MGKTPQEGQGQPRTVEPMMMMMSFKGHNLPNSYRLTLIKFSVGTKRQHRGTAEKSQATVRRLKFVNANTRQTDLPKYVFL